MANDAKFNFYLNRQGPRGQKGEKGDQGFSPSITVNTNTADEYTLLIQNEYNNFVTDNIRPTYDDRGGTYVRVDRDNNVQYFGSADIATTANYGEVKLAQASDLASTVDVGNSNVITVELLKTWFDGQLADNLVTTTNNVTIQGQKIFATPTRFADTVRIGNRLLVTQEDTGTITFDSSETGTLIGTDATFKKDVRVNGGAGIDGNLHVSGATNLYKDTSILAPLYAGGGITVRGGVEIQSGVLDATGRNTITQNLILSSGSLKRVKGFSGYLLADTSAILPEEYIAVGDERLPLRLVGTKVLTNGKDVATTDTVDAMQSDLNIAKQDIIEAQGDIDNLQMNKQNKLTAGTGITIDADNVISATGGVVDLPIASSTTLGGIKVGENLTISEDGTLSATGGGGGGTTIDDSTTSSTSTWSSSKINSEINQNTTLQKVTPFTLNLTDNGTLGGSTPACTGSSYENGHPYYYAFKGATSSTPTRELWGPSSPAENQYLILDCVTPIALQSFRWTNGGNSNERFPTIVFKGSNDNSSYTTLGTYNTQNATDDSVTIENYTPYRYYRFDFPQPANWGKIGFISMSGFNRYKLSEEVAELSGDVTTLSGKVTAVEGKTTDLESALANKQDKLTAGEGIQIEQITDGSLSLSWYGKDPSGGVPNPVPIATPIASEIDIQEYMYPCYGSKLDPTTTHSASIRYTMRAKSGRDGMQNNVYGLLAFNFGDYNKIQYEYYNNRFGIFPQMKNGSSNIQLSVSQNFLSIAEGDLITTEIAISGSKKTVDIKVYNKITGTVYATATASNIEWVGGPAGAVTPYFYYDGHDAMGLLTDSIVISNMEDAQTQNIISSTTPITYLTRAQYDALETKDANTMYVITDEEGGGGGGVVSREEFDALVARVAALEASINGGKSA